MAKALRTGKVLIDWSQNTEHKSMVCAYSVRAKAEPTVSTPVGWDEVEAAVRSGDGSRLRFEMHDVLERVTEHGDLFAEVLTVEQRLGQSVSGRAGGGAGPEQLIRPHPRLVELLDPTRRGFAIRPPAHQLRRVAQPAPVELRVAHLADEGRRDRHPVQRHPGLPAAGRALEPAHRAAADEEPVLPRVAIERHGVRRQVARELATRAAAE